MRLLATRAFSMLVLFDVYLARANFAALQERVRQFPVHRKTLPELSVERICRAIDLACIWYPKEVLCLQRSSATTCLLRRSGFSAQMIVGARLMPFQAHAWVECDGKVVNDRPYVTEMYAVLDRC